MLGEITCMIRKTVGATFSDGREHIGPFISVHFSNKLQGWAHNQILRSSRCRSPVSHFPIHPAIDFEWFPADGRPAS